MYWHEPVQYDQTRLVAVIHILYITLVITHDKFQSTVFIRFAKYVMDYNAFSNSITDKYSNFMLRKTLGIISTGHTRLKSVYFIN